VLHPIAGLNGCNLCPIDCSRFHSQSPAIGFVFSNSFSQSAARSTNKLGLFGFAFLDFFCTILLRYSLPHIHLHLFAFCKIGFVFSNCFGFRYSYFRDNSGQQTSGNGTGVVGFPAEGRHIGFVFSNSIIGTKEHRNNRSLRGPKHRKVSCGGRGNLLFYNQSKGFHYGEKAIVAFEILRLCSGFLFCFGLIHRPPFFRGTMGALSIIGPTCAFESKIYKIVDSIFAVSLCVIWNKKFLTFSILVFNYPRFWSICLRKSCLFHQPQSDYFLSL
jgi:hypothetical protein